MVSTDAATAAAIWSAIAACFAALAAFILVFIERRNLLESVRPELVLTDWSRYERGQGDALHEVIAFKTIRNIGRGPALHLHINLKGFRENRPTAFLSTTRLPILGVNESEQIDGQIAIWWKNIEDRGHGKYRALEIQIYCWDSGNVRHETLYSLFVLEARGRAVIADQILPGVGLLTRRTYSTAVWRLKLRARLATIPLIGRIFTEKIG